MIRFIMIVFIQALIWGISDAQGQSLCGALSQDNAIDQNFYVESPYSSEWGLKSQDSSLNITNTRLAGDYLQVTSFRYEFLSELDSILRSKTVEIFDINGNIIQSMNYSWIETDNDWRLYWKQINFYDDQGRFINGISYKWDYETVALIPERKGETTYSDTSSIYRCKVWDKELSDWINECGNNYYYDEFGDLIFIKQLYWETSSNEWIFWRYEELDYDEFGNEVSIRYMYDSLTENYMLYSKTKKTAEEINPRIREVFYWDQITESWILFEVYEQHYDEFGNQILFMGYNLDTLLNEFYISIKVEYEYEENGYIIQYTSIQWDETGATLYGWKENNYYSKNGEIEYKVRYDVDDTGSEWLLDYKKFYYWSDVITEADETVFNDILVFPNPTFSIIFFLGLSEISSIQLHSISGAVVFEGQISDNRLDLTELKPGMYILSFYDQNKTHLVKRIVKQ